MTLAVLRGMNVRARPEESAALRACVLVTVLAATVATLAQGVGGLAVAVASTAGIAAGFVYSHLARHDEGRVLKAFLAVGAVLAVAHFLASPVVTAGETGGVLVALAELFLWIQFLHSLHAPARRDLLFSLLSSLVLMAVAGALSVSLDIAPHLLVWAVAGVASLVLAYRSELAELPGPAPAATRERRSLASAPRLAGTVGALVALVGVVGTAVLLVVPAAGVGKAVTYQASLPRRLQVPTPGGLANPSLGPDDPAYRPGSSSSTRASFGYFGFSRTLDTGLRGRPDDTLVMRVRASQPDFWRGQTFDRWDGRTWSATDTRPQAVRGDWGPIELPGAPEDRVAMAGGDEFVQTVFVERPGPNVIFAAYAPAQLYFSDRAVFQLPDGTIRTGVQLEEGAVYTVVSRRPVVTPAILRAADASRRPTPPDLTRRYTQLPAVPRRVADLAAEVTATAPTTYDKVRALEAWMADNVTYSLDIPPLPAGRDAVEQFLFVDRQGFCEQIGTALVVMLRSLGIPARLAVGYTPGERNPFTNLYDVRANDAHAWAEVWFPGVGWQGFDPTASVPLSGEAGALSAGAGISRFIASRLPGLTRTGSYAAAGLAAVTLAVGAGAWARDRAAGRRRRRSRSWADLYLERLEATGARRGRPRRSAESAGVYAARLSRSVLPDPRVAGVGAVVEADAFSGSPASEADRALAEQVLAEAEAAFPVPR